MSSSIARHDEVERKYDVADDLPLPALTAVDGVASMGQQVVLELEAVYFDTPSMDLHRHGISVRRRTGGVDEGWHVKLPREGDRRTELQVPLGRGVRTVPSRLLEPIRAIVRDRPLQPVATVRTHRLQQAVLDDAGRALATLCDDRVVAESLLAPDRKLSWREVELELQEGQPAGQFERLETPLLECGAVVSASTSKVRRVLGDVEQPRDDTGGPKGHRRRRGRKTPAGTVLLQHVEDQVAAILHQDRGVREGDRRAVHQLRIAARRLRSSLDAFAPLMAAGANDVVIAELRWVGQVLAPARDAEVLRQRLDGLVEDQPAELVLGPVASRIDRDLAKAHRAGAEAAREAMRSERYYRLLDLLDDLVRAPQWSDLAAKRADKVLPPLLEKSARAVRRAARRAGAADGAEHDAALHTVRKKTKRLRYAAESAQDALGPGTRKLARRAKQVQSFLGDHQDSVVARAALRQWGIDAHLDGDNAFTFGLLHALEQERGRSAEEAFGAAVAGLGAKDVKRNLSR